MTVEDWADGGNLIDVLHLDFILTRFFMNVYWENYLCMVLEANYLIGLRYFCKGEGSINGLFYLEQMILNIPTQWQAKHWRKYPDLKS